MAKILNKLSPLTIKSLMTKVKREGKSVKVADGGGLYFAAEPERSSWGRFDYRCQDKLLNIKKPV